MKKMAVFAEGGTEQAFVENLLEAAAGKKNIRIEKRKVRGGNQCGRHARLTQLVGEAADQKYYALIYDCGNDERVKSDLLERYDSLCRQDFSQIIGIRDVYPRPATDIPKLRQYLRYGVRTKPVDPLMILAVMEVEAWFLAEHTHFVRIHPSLSLDLVRMSLSFDPSQDDVEGRESPAADLNLAYQAVGERYEKTPESIQRTIDALDYAQVFYELRHRVGALKPLVAAIDEFLS